MTDTTQFFDMWKKQVEEGSQAWLRMLSTPQAAPMDPQAFWRPFMDQGMAAWSKVMTQGQAPPDLMAQWKQFLDQWIEAWSRVLGQAMNTESFAKLMGGSLENWLAAQAPLKKAGEQAVEQTLQGMNVASRTQLTSVAKQIVELEERLERVEDGIQAILKRLESRERA